MSDKGHADLADFVDPFVCEDRIAQRAKTIYRFAGCVNPATDTVIGAFQPTMPGKLNARESPFGCRRTRGDRRSFAAKRQSVRAAAGDGRVARTRRYAC